MKKSDKGQVLVLVALAIFALLGLAALGIDVGYMYSIRHELQRSADSGALAGASRFIEPGAVWSPNPNDPVMVLADNTARDYASRDMVATSRLDPTAEVVVGFPSESRIRVTTQRNAQLFFARVLGRDNQVITATAVAEAAIADTGVKCLKPWGIPIPWTDTNGNGKYDSDEPVPSNMDPIPLGTKIIIKIAEPFNKGGQLDLPSLQQESGHFFAIDLCGDRGASDYRDRIQDKCHDDCIVNIGDNLTLEPGNMVGPTKQGVEYLLDQDPGGVWNEGTDTVDGSSYPTYKDSPRFVHIPVYNPEQLLNNGRVEMTVAGFAGFWISGWDTKQGTVTGYYVPDTAGSGAGGSGPGPGPVLRILRLVE